MSCYELVVIYDKEYGEVIAFESDRFMNDSNDIVNEAIKLKLFEENTVIRYGGRSACPSTNLNI